MSEGVSGKAYRVTYMVLGKEALVVESLQVYANLWNEVAGRVSWYRTRYGPEIELMDVSAMDEYRYEAGVRDGDGVPLCWDCLEPAIAVCDGCGHQFCKGCIWSMRVEVRVLLAVAPGHLVAECSECICK